MVFVLHKNEGKLIDLVLASMPEICVPEIFVPEFFELYEAVTGNTEIVLEDINKPSVGCYEKFIKKMEDNSHKEVGFDEALEFQKFAEGKRPCGNCIIWGCTRKTTRKCKCGCLQFVCRECMICIVQA